MAKLSDVTDFVKAMLPDYQISSGPWVDTPQNATQHIAAVYMISGTSRNMETVQRFRIILLGPKNMRGAFRKVGDDADKFVQAYNDGARPCGVSGMTISSTPVGPGFTTEDRAWYQIDIQTLQ